MHPLTVVQCESAIEMVLLHANKPVVLPVMHVATSAQQAINVKPRSPYACVTSW